MLSKLFQAKSRGFFHSRCSELEMNISFFPSPTFFPLGSANVSQLPYGQEVIPPLTFMPLSTFQITFASSTEDWEWTSWSSRPWLHIGNWYNISTKQEIENAVPTSDIGSDRWLREGESVKLNIPDSVSSVHRGLFIDCLLDSCNSHKWISGHERATATVSAIE